MTSFIPSERTYDALNKDTIETKPTTDEFMVEGSFQPAPDFDEYNPFPYDENDNSSNRPTGLHEYDPDSSGQALYEDIFNESNAIDPEEIMKGMDLETLGDGKTDTQSFEDRFKEFTEKMKTDSSKTNFEAFLKVAYYISSAKFSM